MEKQEFGGAAGSLTQESPGGAPREVPGGSTGVEAGPGLPSGAVVPQGSGHSGIVIRSLDSSRGSGVVAAQGSRPKQPPGEVVGHSLASGTYPGGFNAPIPGTCAAGTSDFGSKESGVHNSECSPRSGSTSLHPPKPYEDPSHSILKTSNPTLIQKPPSAESTKKSQHWDEINIMTTYHPADKDYGFMKVDEPSTPYHRLPGQDSDEPSHTVTPEALRERFATMDNFYPKVLQHPDNRSSGSSDFSKSHSSGFEKHRKTHYNEGKFLNTQKNQLLGNNKKSNGGSESSGSGGRGVMLDPESRPVERGWAGGLARGVKDKMGPESRPVERSWAGALARGVKDKIGLVTKNHLQEAEDSSTFRNQSPSSTIIMSDKEADLQRKEYYSKGRYLRCSPHPELEEDMEDDSGCSTSLIWASENSVGTEVRSLDHRGSPLWDHRPSRAP